MPGSHAPPPSIDRWAVFGWLILGAFGAVLVAVLAGTLTIGVGTGYYLLPWEHRVEHPWHHWLRPGGPWGLSLGITGTSLMVAMLSYTVRKWLLGVRFLGAPVWWLRFHILCGLTGPLFIVLHAGLLPPWGLVAVGFYCMVLVASSGLFGRYVYGHFPATAAGLALDARAARRELADLRARIVAETADADAERIGRAVALVHHFEPDVRTLLGWVWLDLEVRNRSQQIPILLAQAGLPAASRQSARDTLVRHLKLQRNVAAWDVSRRLFRYWHLFHDPLAKAMYLIILVHVGQAMLFGGAWQSLFEWSGP